jgi:glycosyltransferase involved in cell wall biosynthesis
VTAVHVVAPDAIHDPSRPSGGNTYDRHLCRELASIGWSVHEHTVPGGWPQPDRAAVAALDSAIRRVPGGALVLVDGLIASAVPEVLVPQADRVRLVVLVHMPLGHRPADNGGGEVRTRERAVLAAADAVVTTSSWTRGRLAELYGLPAERMHVAEPGVDPADLATGTASGEALLCVAAVTFDKGHDVLVDALASMADLSWRCTCAGSLERDPEFAEAIRHRSLDAGLGERVRFPGPVTGTALDRAYAAADLVVLPSRAETYGMVVVEALARGVPVLATEVGGVTEALGQETEGGRPGLLVPPGDPESLGASLRAWLRDAGLRETLRRAARARRERLAGWASTASAIADALTVPLR